MTHFTILINITVKCPKRVHIPQRVKSFKNVLLFVELAQELPQSHLQYTDDPLRNTVMKHSTVKCPKTSVPEKHKTLKGSYFLVIWCGRKGKKKGSYCWACSGITSKPPAVHWRIILTQKIHFLKSTCLKFVSLLPISSCLWWLVHRNNLRGCVKQRRNVTNST